MLGGAAGLFNSTPRLFDISMDAYNGKRFKNGWDKNTNTDRTK
jgi:hypothetical protein